MFQMSKQLFDQCWPAIADLLQRNSHALPAEGDAAPGTVAAAEAKYVLGVAIGYALRVDQPSGAWARPMPSEPAGERPWRSGTAADRVAPRVARNDRESALALRRATR